VQKTARSSLAETDEFQNSLDPRHKDKILADWLEKFEAAARRRVWHKRRYNVR